MRLIIIAAVAQNGVIGRNNTLPWKQRSDMKRFKEVTMGHTLLCGRKTYESIGRPLPGRSMVILSRNPEYKVEGCKTHTGVESALWHNGRDRPMFCIGGAEIYKEALQFATELDITRILADVDGDTFFPKFGNEWQLVSSEKQPQSDKDEHPFQYEKYIKKGCIYDQDVAKQTKANY